MSDTSQNQTKTVPRTAVMVCGTIVVLAILGSYLLMELNGKSSGSLLTLITGLIAAGGATAAWSNSKDSKRDTAEIRQQTNGPLTEGLDRLAAMEAKLEDMDQRLRDKGI